MKSGGKVSKLFISFSASNENPAVGNESQETLETKESHGPKICMNAVTKPEKWVVRAFRRVARVGIGLLRHDIHENKTLTTKRKTRSPTCRMDESLTNASAQPPHRVREHGKRTFLSAA